MIGTIVSPKGLLIAAAIGFAGGCTVTSWYWQAGEGKALQRAVDDAALKATGLEIQLELQRRQAKDINRRYADEIRKEDYRCFLPVDGLQLLNSARTSTGEHASPMP